MHVFPNAKSMLDIYFNPYCRHIAKQAMAMRDLGDPMLIHLYIKLELRWFSKEQLVNFNQTAVT